MHVIVDMGKNQSRELSRGEQAGEDLEEEGQRMVHIQCAQDMLSIPIADDSLTFGWLLSEAIRTHRGPGSLVALRSADEQDVIDVMLETMSTRCSILQNNTTLVGVFAGRL